MPVHIELPLDPPARTPAQELANKIHYALEEEEHQLSAISAEYEEVKEALEGKFYCPFAPREQILDHYESRISGLTGTIAAMKIKLQELGYGA